MKSPVYVPIVKGKLYDVMAIGALSSQERNITKPLIETMPINPKKPAIDEHVHKFCQYIRKHVPLGELFVDFYGLMPDACAPDGTNATIFGYQLLKGVGRYATPVYGLERNDELWISLKDVVATFNKGFAFRLRRDDLAEDLVDETWSSIVERSAQMGLKEDAVDLILDFASLPDADTAEIEEAVISFLFHNPRVRRYRSIVVAASSALRTVGDIEKDGVSEVLRSELHLWSRLWNDMPDDVKPIYGDYGVIHPDFSDIGPNKYMNAKIRYTVGDKIVYFRGHGLLHPVKDYNQYYDLAKKVVTDTRYRTRKYSFGDSYIDDCARKLGKPGAPGTWVRADMNHHITYAAEQVDRLVKVFASLPNPEDAAALLTAV
ncbi:beta family protein [Burkholderia pseudomallei]|uniref:beta family protein n=1 Tax=Burkholderia pseudomallei TaxID=28450 RepID=UPI0005E3AF1A|nr:beta family protein [Burkholderia pseudomallei]CFL19805.1 Uncharacterised protein [Burkholderia pseudomallei]